ncbi:MAG: BamA/OMP85 family outer membrane protein [Gemmatimonadota bacterium]
MIGPRGAWLLVSAALLAGAAWPAAGQRPEVVALEFEGARSFTSQELASATVTRATRCRNILYQAVCWLGVGEDRAYLDPDELEADVFRLRVYYYERGFREVEIAADTVSAGDRVKVVFTIREGRPVRVDAVELAGAPASLRIEPLPVAVGDPFDVVAYEATRDTLRSRLRDSGYARAEVLVGYSIEAEDPYAATLRYDMVPGPALRIGPIEVEGTVETSPTLVHRMLAFEEGDLYDRSALLRSQRNLYGLQVFQHAIVDADVDADTAVVPIRVRVAEGAMRRVRVGGGANNVECGNVEGRWLSRNFLGDGRRLSVTGRLGNLLINHCGWLVDDDYASYTDPTGVFSVDFTQPWFFGPRNNIGVGVFAERRNVPEVFVRSAAGGYVSVGRSLGGKAALSLAYRPEITGLDTHQAGDLFFCVNFVSCTYEHLDVLRDPHMLAPLALSFTMDRTDALFRPSSGYTVRAEVEHAGTYTLSDFAYTRLQAEGSAYMGEPGGVVLATRIRGGIGWPHPGGEGSATLGLNPQKRFFAGGPNSVRGFDQYRLGPTVLGIDAVPWLVQPDDSLTDGAGCSPGAVNDLSCDASGLARAHPHLFDQRPSGGEVLLEGNMELRFPLPAFGGKLRGAAFLDFGQVWRTRDDVSLNELMATPGLGVRYYTPVGPIRVDAAFNPRGTQELQVLTTRVETCTMDQPGCRRVGDAHRLAVRNTDTVALLDGPVTFGSPLHEMDSLGDFLRRFNLQFSIGQAF